MDGWTDGRTDGRTQPPTNPPHKRHTHAIYPLYLPTDSAWSARYFPRATRYHHHHPPKDFPRSRESFPFRNPFSLASRPYFLSRFSYIFSLRFFFCPFRFSSPVSMVFFPPAPFLTFLFRNRYMSVLILYFGRMAPPPLPARSLLSPSCILYTHFFFSFVKSGFYARDNHERFSCLQLVGWVVGWMDGLDLGTEGGRHDRGGRARASSHERA